MIRMFNIYIRPEGKHLLDEALVAGAKSFSETLVLNTNNGAYSSPTELFTVVNEKVECTQDEETAIINALNFKD